LKKSEEKVIRFIRDNDLIRSGERILIALSGGADSVFLLYFLNKFKKKYKSELAALHVNHLIRGKNADDDEKFCRGLCSKLDVKFYPVRKNVKLFASKNKMSVEEAGRTLRYKLLTETAEKYNYDKIATAHNLSDNAETLLFNLIKGTGLKGLSGIPVKRGKIIRPILSLSKSEIISYLEQNKILCRTDESNLSDDYERNFIRNNIIPLIKMKLNPAFEDAAFNTSAIIKNFYNYLTSKVDELIPEAVSFKEGVLRIDLEALKNIDETVISELIKNQTERNFSVPLAFKDVKALTGLISSAKGEKVNLLSGLIASREKDSVVVYRETESFTAVSLKIGENAKVNDKSLYISEAEKSSFTSSKPGVEYITADDIDEIFTLREWKEGDRFFPIGMKGTKKVSDFLNERKIESYLKRKHLVLINRNRIVWIVGLRLDERFKITGNTNRVLKLCLK
jgi:tRNA(Ile)-lysidine synthase